MINTPSIGNICHISSPLKTQASFDHLEMQTTSPPKKGTKMSQPTLGNLRIFHTFPEAASENHKSPVNYNKSQTESADDLMPLHRINPDISTFPLHFHTVHPYLPEHCVSCMFFPI